MSLLKLDLVKKLLEYSIKIIGVFRYYAMGGGWARRIFNQGRRIRGFEAARALSGHTSAPLIAKSTPSKFNVNFMKQ